jgi:hypothetical protein
LKKCFGCQGGVIRLGVVPGNAGESVETAEAFRCRAGVEDVVMAPNDFFNGLLARVIHEALPRSS